MDPKFFNKIRSLTRQGKLTRAKDADGTIWSIIDWPGLHTLYECGDFPAITYEGNRACTNNGNPIGVYACFITAAKSNGERYFFAVPLGQ